MEPSSLIRVSYEVFGRVQNVFFRRDTNLRARQLHLRGWVMNTPRGTVTGQLEGPRRQVEEMKHWLRNVGSKRSRIEDLRVSEEAIDRYSFPDFRVRK